MALKQLLSKADQNKLKEASRYIEIDPISSNSNNNENETESG